MYGVACIFCTKAYANNVKCKYTRVPVHTVESIGIKRGMYADIKVMWM